MSQEGPASTEESLPSGQLYRLAWGFYLVLGLAGVIWIGARDGTISLALFFGPRWWLDLAAGAGVGLFLLAGWWGAAKVWSLARELEERIAQVLGSLDVSQAVALAVMSGFAEELFFRGAVQGSWGLGVATVLFAITHTGRERCFRLWTVFALISGLLFGALVVWSGTLLGAIAGHTLVNAVNLVRIAVRDEAAAEDPQGGEE